MRKTASEIIDGIGVEFFRAQFKMSDRNIRHIRQHNTFAPKYYLVLKAEAEKRGIHADTDLFSFVELGGEA